MNQNSNFIYDNDLYELANKTRYNLSNCSYIVFSINGTPSGYPERNIKNKITFDQYINDIIPILDMRFPRFDNHDYNEDILRDLDENEAYVIRNQILSKGYDCIMIPKTLYDLLYIYFRLVERMNYDGPLIRNKQSNKTIKTQILEDDVAWNLCRDKLKFYVPPLQFFSGSSPDGIYSHREQNVDYRRCLYSLNNNILDFLLSLDKTCEIKSDHMNIHNTLEWNVIESIVNYILENVKELRSEYKDIDFGCFDMFNYNFFRFFHNRCKKVVINALLNEYTCQPNIYSIYRSLESEKDDAQDDDGNPISLAFGDTVLQGIIYDGTSGSVLGWYNGHNQINCFNIKKSSYCQKKDSHTFLYIPPCRDINRTTEVGEFGHIRSKILKKSILNDDKYLEIKGIDRLMCDKNDDTFFSQITFLYVDKDYEMKKYRESLLEFLDNHRVTIIA